MKNLNKSKNTKENILLNSEKSMDQTEKKKNEIPILDLLKCPTCKKICLMNINKDKLLFSFECTNIHKNNNINKIFKKCKTVSNEPSFSYNSELAEINLSKEPKKINNKDNNTSKMTNATLQKLYITEKDITCQFHPNLKYSSYCFECKKNICDECSKEHLSHNQINLNSIKPNDKEVFLCKKNIKKNEKILWDLIDYIQKWKMEFDKGLNTLIKIMENIFNLKEFIIDNYDQKQNNQNYNYIQNFNNIKTIDFIFPELKNFSEKKDFKQIGYDIIDSIYNINNKISENKKKIKNNIPKNNENNNNNIKYDNNEITSNDTAHKTKSNNFSTIYTSDCKNNNFYSIDVSKGRNKQEVNIKDNYLTKTIEQNAHLENEKNDEEKNNKNTEIENDQIITKEIETNRDNEEANIDILKVNNNNNIINISNNNPIENNGDFYEIEDENQNNNNENINENNDINNINNIELNLENNNNIEEPINNKEENNNNNNYEEIRNKYIYNGIELKSELNNTDIIRSIEFLNNKKIIICTLENIAVYKINSNDKLIKEFDIKEFNYRINYVTKLSDNNLIICSFNNICIINLSEDDLGSYNIIQKLECKNDSENINKIKEIKEKNYLISCDKNNIILYEKNLENNLYNIKNDIKINSEVKCFEKINPNYILTVEPEKQKLIFYDIDTLQLLHEINNIQSSFGRYVICYIEKYEIIFITGRYGIYLISSKNFDSKIFFFKADEWISSINYNIKSNCLFCGTWQKDKNNLEDKKNYNLIIYDIIQNESENKIENIKLREITRKNNAHNNDIVVIQTSINNGIITGSNDKTVKIWK